jgi:hypothetical protein
MSTVTIKLLAVFSMFFTLFGAQCSEHRNTHNITTARSVQEVLDFLGITPDECSRVGSNTIKKLQEQHKLALLAQKNQSAPQTQQLLINVETHEENDASQQQQCTGCPLNKLSPLCPVI